MGGCQHDGPFLDPYDNLGYPKKDHSLDRHPYVKHAEIVNPLPSVLRSLTSYGPSY